MNKYSFKITKGVYVLKTKTETITGRSYFDCLVKLIKAPIPIGLAKMNIKARFNWVEDQLKQKGI
jgi:hypothetical protein|tara:strand:- start:157 stop:351 length:195 start_codon:yes stop_codon:yes gene_type:complete